MKWRSMDTVPKTGDDLVAKPFQALIPTSEFVAPDECVVIAWWEPKLKGGIFVREGGDVDVPVEPLGWLPVATAAGMPMDFADFHNALRILLNIDQPEFVETIPAGDLDFMKSEKGGGGVDREWRRFRDEPHRYFITCGDEQSAKLFAIIQERNSAVARPK